MEKDKQITIRVNSEQLENVKRLLGLSDNSKAIRASMCCVENVIQNTFGGEVQLIFQRSKKDETKPKYENSFQEDSIMSYIKGKQSKEKSQDVRQNSFLG